MLPRFMTVISVLAAVLGALLGYTDYLSTFWAAAIVVGSGFTAALSKGLTDATDNYVWTLLGVLGAAISAGGVALQTFNPKYGLVALAISSAFIAAGKALTPKAAASPLILCLILLSQVAAKGCGADQLKTTEEAIRKVYVGLQGASAAVEEIYQSKVRKIESDFSAEKITAEQRDKFLKDAGDWALAAQLTLRQSGVAVKQFKESARKLPEITKDNKVQLYPLLDELIANIEKARQNGLLNLERDRVATIEIYYEMVKSGAVTLQTSIKAIKKSVPTKDIPALAQ